MHQQASQVFLLARSSISLLIDLQRAAHRRLPSIVARACVEKLRVITEGHTVSLVRHRGAEYLSRSLHVSARGLEHGCELRATCLLPAEHLQAALTAAPRRFSEPKTPAAARTRRCACSSHLEAYELTRLQRRMHCCQTAAGRQQARAVGTHSKFPISTTSTPGTEAIS